MPFPVAKLFYMAIKQVSKPIAKSIKNKATKSPFLRNYILLPPAQFYHSMESKIRLSILGIGRSSKSRKMDETKAIELASEMLGEIIVFSVAAATLFAEYKRQSNKEVLKEENLNKRLVDLEEKLDSLTNVMENLVKATDEREQMIDNKQLENIKASVARLEISEYMKSEGIQTIGFIAKPGADVKGQFTLTREKDS